LSKADDAGLKPGDFVTHVNGTPVRTPAEFQAACRAIKNKATLRLLGRRSVDVGT
jgi:S1-C subfamily serine protease